MRRSSLALCTLIALAALPGCVQHHHPRGHGPPAGVVVSRSGPPPHAPAHGHRHKHHHHGVELVFDSELGVYAVAGRADHFFHEDRFYRLVDSTWEVSTRIDRGWVRIHSRKLPKGLAKRVRARRLGWKHRHPAKHRH